MNSTTTTTLPTYHRKNGRCIRRTDVTKGIEVVIPDDPKEKLPLMMSNVTFPSKERFDDHLKDWEEVDLACFENYVYGFIGRVATDVSKPMTERMIEKQLAITNNHARK